MALIIVDADSCAESPCCIASPHCVWAAAKLDVALAQLSMPITSLACHAPGHALIVLSFCSMDRIKARHCNLSHHLLMTMLACALQALPMLLYSQPPVQSF